MQTTLYSHLRVPKHLLDMRRVRAELTITNLKYAEKASMGYAMKEDDVPAILLYEEDNDYVILPRGYNPPWDARGGGCRNRLIAIPEIVDLRPEWPHVPGFRFKGELREYQYPAVNALRDVQGDKLLCLGCGKGKTVLALWYAAALSKKTLIIVDQDFLINQWMRRIESYLGIKEKDIGRVQGNYWGVGRHITIAMIPTLRRRDLTAEFCDQFGLIIVDEAHVLGANQSQNLLPCFPGERLILTATPERKDGLHPVFLLHAGGLKPAYVDLSRDQSSQWYFINLPQVLSPEQLEEYIDVGKGKRKRRVQLAKALYKRMPQWPRPRFHRPTYETAAGVSVEFNLQILAEVFKAQATGRNVLVLGSRTDQLEALDTAAREEMGMDSSLVTGNVKADAREEAFKHQVIFATWQIAGRALDIERLDTLVLLYPTDDDGFLRQAVGRIDRLVEDKRKSLVIVFNHPTYDSIDRKTDAMRSTILEIDPGATIKTVSRACLLPRIDEFRALYDGATRAGTAPTRGPTPKVASRPSRDGNSSLMASRSNSTPPARSAPSSRGISAASISGKKLTAFRQRFSASVTTRSSTAGTRENS